MADPSQISNTKRLGLELALAVWRRKWLALAVCWAVCAIGWTAVLVMPRQYESDARVFVDINGVLTPLLKGLLPETSIGQTEAYLSQTLLSRPNLEKTLVLANLDTGQMSETDKDEKIEALAQSVKLTPQANGLVLISAEEPSPVVAKSVVDALVTIFAEAAARSSRAEIEKAHAFLDQQIATTSDELRAVEERRAELRKKYGDFLPDPTSGAPRLQTLETEVKGLQEEYDKTRMARDVLVAQARATPALLTVGTAPVASAGGSLLAATPQQRLAEARRVLAELQLRYTDQHPDVQTAKRDVAELEQRARNGSNSEGTTQISNPTYEQIRMKLVDIDTILPSLKQRLDDATAELAHLKASASQLPEIEIKENNLDRDYGVVKANYDELVKRRESASLSQAADEQADRTQFRIIDPPELPLAPSFPNFPIMLSAVLLIGLGAGAGVPIGLANLRPTFSSMTRLRELGLPVIGAVTKVRQQTAALALTARPVAVVTCLAVLVSVYAALMAMGLGLQR